MASLLHWSLVCFILQWEALICQAIYPAPGSYYSLLLQYNNRGKTRKVARLAPSPHKLYAFFDPPAALGSLSSDYMHNSVEKEYLERIKTERKMQREKMRRNKKEEVLTSRFHKQEARFKSHPAAEELKASSISYSPSFRPGEGKTFHEIEAASQLQKSSRNVLDKWRRKSLYRSKHTDFRSQFRNVSGSCGWKDSVSLYSPSQQLDKKGRFFIKRIQSQGFPTLYEIGAHCEWRVELGDECQMGMVVYEIHEGNAFQSKECLKDFISIAIEGQQESRVCGPLGGVVGTRRWVKASNKVLKVTFKTGERKTPLNVEKPYGFRMTLSGYCWIYSPAYHYKVKPHLSSKDRRKKHPEVKLTREKPSGQRDKIKKHQSPTANVRLSSLPESEHKTSSHQNNVGKTLNQDSLTLKRQQVVDADQEKKDPLIFAPLTLRKEVDPAILEVSVEAPSMLVDNPRALTLDNSGRPIIYELKGTLKRQTFKV